MRFADQVVIVTGGAQGIGRACVEAFADEGAAVVIADIAVEGGRQVAAAINARGGRARFIETNVGDAAQGALGNGRVVRDEIELRVAGLGKEDLAGVGDHDLAAGDLQHGFHDLVGRSLLPEALGQPDIVMLVDADLQEDGEIVALLEADGVVAGAVVAKLLREIDRQ